MSNTGDKAEEYFNTDSTDMIMYLPYLLQDLWDIGYSSKSIKYLISKHCITSEKTKILDLACGKGAVSVSLAEKFGCIVKGIDIVPEFIAYAKKKAKKYSVDDQCEFKVEDVNQSVNNEKDFDIVIFATVGNILGNWVETLLKLKGAVKRSGHILLSDGFCDSGINETYPTSQQWRNIFQEAGLKVIDEKNLSKDEMAEINGFFLGHMIKRANELKQYHPEKASFFEGFIQSQQAECERLEREVTGVTWLLQAV